MNKYSGYIGLEALYVWLCAALYWNTFDNKLIAFIGATLVSICQVATFLYANSLETEI
ncbi:MAG: hypothetical protein WC742_04190 [Gallionellaceae bacterium]|jgi:hypothetical protein